MDCRWDQKIPNEPILDRNFIIAQPPIIPFERPCTTTCTRAAPVGVIDFSKRVSPQEELRIANFWYAHTIAKGKTGLPLNANSNFNANFNFNGDFNGNFNFNFTLQQYLVQYPDRPWMRGVFNNITAENAVKPYQVAVALDCIPKQELVKQQMQHQITHERVLAKEQELTFAPPYWDQNTSLKLRTKGRN